MKTISTIRRENLDTLISESGSLVALAFSAKSSSVYLSQIKHQEVDKKTGKPRQMGSQMARRLEIAAEKPLGWMDRDHSAEIDTARMDPLAITSQRQDKTPTESEAVLAALRDWRMQASAKSLEVIDQLTLLAQKNALRDDDWKLLEQMTSRLKQASS